MIEPLRLLRPQLSRRRLLTVQLVRRWRRMGRWMRFHTPPAALPWFMLGLSVGLALAYAAYHLRGLL